MSDHCLPCRRLFLPLFVGGLVMLTGACTPSQIKPPIATRIPKAHTIHGATVVDDYHWLKDRSDPKVVAYLEAENAYTAEAM